MANDTRKTHVLKGQAWFANLQKPIKDTYNTDDPGPDFYEVNLCLTTDEAKKKADELGMYVKPPKPKMDPENPRKQLKDEDGTVLTTM